MILSSYADGAGAVGGTMMALIICFLILLAVLAFLMPLFVYAIYKDCQRMRKMAEANSVYIRRAAAGVESLKEQAEKNQLQIKQLVTDVERMRRRWEA